MLFLKPASSNATAIVWKEKETMTLKRPCYPY